MSDIFTLFAGLDRAGPGDRESLDWAVSVAGTPADATILDAGCGTGADLPGLLAAAPRGRVVAIDTAPEFIAQVRARFPSVEAHVADMADPPDGPYDLIWSAGAVYQIGVSAALAAWAGRLAAGGRVAFSDLCWRQPEPPEEVCAFFAAEGVYPSDDAALEAAVVRAGWRVIGSRWLGDAGWAAYYEPLATHLDAFSGPPALIAAFRTEIALWRAHGQSFGYRVIVAEPA